MPSCTIPIMICSTNIDHIDLRGQQVYAVVTSQAMGQLGGCTYYLLHLADSGYEVPYSDVAIVGAGLNHKWRTYIIWRDAIWIRETI